MNFPVVTKPLALRVGKSEADYFASWLKVMQAQPGNPFGIEIRQFGNAVALVNSDATLGPTFNRVLGFGDADAERLDEIVQFYEERDLSCRIDINPYEAGPKLFDYLEATGLHPFRFHNHLYGVPSLLPRQENHQEENNQENGVAVTAREIRAEEVALWAEVWHQGYAEALGVPTAMAGQIADATQGLHGQPGWGLYLAFADGQPAAAGALFVQDGVGSVLMGGTLPEFRRRGCQTALLRVRIADAAKQGCDLVAAQAALDATSQHNMERVGMRIAYTRAFWFRR